MYELAIFYRDGLGVPADASRSFQLLQKAAEANYVPAMTPLSDVYAAQKTPVSGQRATYWATKPPKLATPRAGWFSALNTTPESWAAIRRMAPHGDGGV